MTVTITSKNLASGKLSLTYVSDTLGLWNVQIKCKTENNQDFILDMPIFTEAHERPFALRRKLVILPSCSDWELEFSGKIVIGLEKLSL